MYDGRHSAPGGGMDPRERAAPGLARPPSTSSLPPEMLESISNRNAIREEGEGEGGSRDAEPRRRSSTPTFVREQFAPGAGVPAGGAGDPEGPDLGFGDLVDGGEFEEEGEFDDGEEEEGGEEEEEEDDDDGEDLDGLGDDDGGGSFEEAPGRGPPRGGDGGYRRRERHAAPAGRREQDGRAEARRGPSRGDEPRRGGRERGGSPPAGYRRRDDDRERERDRDARRRRRDGGGRRDGGDRRGRDCGRDGGRDGGSDRRRRRDESADDRSEREYGKRPSRRRGDDDGRRRRRDRGSSAGGSSSRGSVYGGRRGRRDRDYDEDDRGYGRSVYGDGDPEEGGDGVDDAAGPYAHADPARAGHEADIRRAVDSYHAFAEQTRRETDEIERTEILYRLRQLEKDGFPPSKRELYRQTREADRERGLKWLRQLLVTGARFLELGNARFNPFDLNLRGYSRSVALSVGDFDGPRLALHSHYSGRGAGMHPVAQIALAVAGSAVFHCASQVAEDETRTPTRAGQVLGAMAQRARASNPFKAMGAAAAAAAAAGGGGGQARVQSGGVGAGSAVAANGAGAPRRRMTGPPPSDDEDKALFVSRLTEEYDGAGRRPASAGSGGGRVAPQRLGPLGPQLRGPAHAHEGVRDLGHDLREVGGPREGVGVDASVYKRGSSLRMVHSFKFRECKGCSRERNRELAAAEKKARAEAARALGLGSEESRSALAVLRGARNLAHREPKSTGGPLRRYLALVAEKRSCPSCLGKGRVPDLEAGFYSVRSVSGAGGEVREGPLARAREDPAVAVYLSSVRRYLGEPSTPLSWPEGAPAAEPVEIEDVPLTPEEEAAGHPPRSRARRLEYAPPPLKGKGARLRKEPACAPGAGGGAHLEEACRRMLAGGFAGEAYRECDVQQVYRLVGAAVEKPRVEDRHADGSPPYAVVIATTGFGSQYCQAARRHHGANRVYFGLRSDGTGVQRCHSRKDARCARPCAPPFKVPVQVFVRAFPFSPRAMAVPEEEVALWETRKLGADYLQRYRRPGTPRLPAGILESEGGGRMSGVMFRDFVKAGRERMARAAAAARARSASGAASSAGKRPRDDEAGGDAAAGTGRCCPRPRPGAADGGAPPAPCEDEFEDEFEDCT
ncbi:hypothetical protein JKP88DRAFT_272162 [Tribonema minus]|uniref:Uncharacterized protein n=1 Tax=Tribonema minus TaxID=303371 RepID=A0A836CPK0_9STRA|nr:hypothetical protein JKP88DRAFT_272162 [Tribonema minus]